MAELLLFGPVAPKAVSASAFRRNQPEYFWIRIIRFLSKNQRLHNAEEFSSVLRFRCFTSGEFFQVFAKPNNLLYPRLGLIVARKVEHLAVNRNQVKRLLRELFRTRQQHLTGLDLVVRLRRPPSRGEGARLTAEAEMLMIQLQRCRE